MDKPNLNMRQRQWLDVLKDYDYEILYHPGKANEVADAFSRRAESAPIRDVCMRMTMMTPVLDIIREAQVEVVRPENRNREWVFGQMSEFVTDIRGRIWVPYTVTTRNFQLYEHYLFNRS